MPLPRFHTIHYAGVLAAASPWRSRLTPPLPPTAENVEPEKRVRKSGYRPWAELLLAAVGELTEVPGRSPPRVPPYWKSQVLRRQALGDQGEDNGTDHEAA